MSLPKYQDLDGEPVVVVEPGTIEVEKIREEMTGSRVHLWFRLGIPFGLACLLFVIIVLPVYFDNMFLRITVLVILVIGLILCVGGILQSKQCRNQRKICDMNKLGDGKLSGTERY